MPTPTIPNGAAYMAATLYTGTGATLSVTNTAGFQPDFVWCKIRSPNAYDHRLMNSVSGVNLALVSDNTNAEASYSGVTSFNSNGFTLGSSGSGINENGSTFVGWQWKAGGTAVSNTSGTITSSVSANTTSGFSIVTYTGTGANATVGHGLGVTPKMVIVKGRSVSGYSWTIWNKPTVDANGAPAVLALESTSAWFNRATSFNSTAPTSSVFSIGTDLGTNTNGGTYVAYCWSEIAGFSQFGSYTGNGSTDGPFIYLGFRPKFWMVKRTDVAAPWIIYDSSRNTYNVANNYLLPNASDAEASGSSPNDVNDFLSNGFKVRCTNAGENFSAASYIYMAFAENPFKYANAR